MPTPSERAMPTPDRFHALLAGLRDTTLQQFAQRERSPGDRRPGVERLLLLGLEQQWKIEAQLLLPALAPMQARAARLASQEIEVLRDLALLAGHGEAAATLTTWTVLQRLAELHACRIDDLLAQHGPAGVDWTRLLAEAETWLAQWAQEIQSTGDIEDEDRDPVGQAPR